MRVKISSNIQEQIYEALKKDIIYGTLEPGVQLKEMDLAEYYNVSRSPIREALRRLCGDGLVELKPNCGIFVRVFTVKYVEDNLEMRILMEGSGMERSCTVGMTEEESQKLLQLRDQIAYAVEHCDELDLSHHMDIDARLHYLFNSFNHNEVMMETWQRIMPVNVVVQRLSLKSGARAYESQEEHLHIIECLLKKDYKSAMDMNRQHLMHTRDHVERSLDKKETLD